MKSLFGTDGIRGIAGEYPLDGKTVFLLGRALGRELTARAAREAPAPRVLIGRDTRASGPLLESCLLSGLRDSGAGGISLGVVSTPALAFLTREGGYAAGAMISASHNPFQDNGIKVLGPDGMKVPDSREAALERMILEEGGVSTPPAAEAVLPPLLQQPEPGLLGAYLDHLIAAAGGPGALEGLSVVLDCAHGSACRIAPEAFRALGASVRVIGCAPDGANINDGCGSMHLGPLCREVAAARADLGLAFDGDADRCLAVDNAGRPLDGDFILFVQAMRLRKAGRLRGDRVVATVMSNLWLEKALAENEIHLLRTQVGDKYVLERMLSEGSSLGGEQSGHVIFLDHFPTGDGVLTGLLMALAAREDGEGLSALAAGIRRYPQVLVNIRVREKPPLEDHPAIGPAIRGIAGTLGGDGRVLVRYSGTERLARVMIEGNDETVVQALAADLARLIRDEIGEET